MSTAVILAKAVAVLTDEKARKRLGYLIAVLLSPLLLAACLILPILSGATEHNAAAVDLVFNGGALPDTMPPAYAAQVQSMQACFVSLDGAMAEVNAMMESGTLEGAMVKAIFFSLCFGDAQLQPSAAVSAAFVDCFVRYEARTRLVEVGVDQVTGETLYEEEIYLVAVALDLESVYSNLSAIGYAVTEEVKHNAQAVYVRTAYGTGGSYTGTIEYGGTPMTELDMAQFTDTTTKNAADLVTFVTQAWQNGWGYVWGTYGQVLTDSLLNNKCSQYPDGVGVYEDFIRDNWLGRRTADCAGLIKSYGWFDPAAMTIGYGGGSMPDIGADDFYTAATVKGTMSTMPDTPGIAVWHAGHIGVYIGNGQVIEAMGTKYGVVKTQLSERNWSAWLEIPYINYN